MLTTAHLFLTKNDFMERLKCFQALVKEKNASELVFLMSMNIGYSARCQRAIVENCSVDDINMMLSNVQGIDYALVIQQILMFRKNDAEFLKEAAEKLIDLEGWERDLILDAYEATTSK